jgi:hypothetical protein
MNGCCCKGEGRMRRLARRLSGAAASLLPGAAVILLPKCPLCLAAWLTAATGGIAFSAPWAERIWWTIAALPVAAVAIVAIQVLRRRALRRASGMSGCAGFPSAA